MEAEELNCLKVLNCFTNHPLIIEEVTQKVSQTENEFTEIGSDSCF